MPPGAESRHRGLLVFRQTVGWHALSASEGRGRSATRSMPSGDAPRPSPEAQGTCQPRARESRHRGLLVFRQTVGWHALSASEGRGRSATRSMLSGDAPRPSPEAQGRATQAQSPATEGLLVFRQTVGWHALSASEGRGRSATRSMLSGDAPRPSPEAQGRASPGAESRHRGLLVFRQTVGWHALSASEGRGRSATQSMPSGDAPRPSPEAQGRATQTQSPATEGLLVFRQTVGWHALSASEGRGRSATQSMPSGDAPRPSPEAQGTCHPDAESRHRAC